MGPYGRPVPNLSDSDLRRYWAKIALPNEDGCTLWAVGQDSKGYGKFWLNGAHWVAHRIAYTLANGPVPDGLVLDHLCRNRACVNPLHLEAVTQRENIQRGDTGKHTIRNACRRGHRYTPETCYVCVSGTRRARTCTLCYPDKKPTPDRFIATYGVAA